MLHQIQNYGPGELRTRIHRTPHAEQVTYERTGTGGQKLSHTRTFRNGLEAVPYLPADPGRRERLLAAIEMINRDRAAAS